MHGRIKVRTTEEQRLIKEKENQKKLAAYRAGMQKILASRKKDPYTPECLDICSQILMSNPDIYTLWNYRKEVALMEIKNCENVESEENKEKLQKFLENELKLTEQCLLANHKSYGSWHHRYWILQHHPEPNWDNEFNLCTKYLAKDDRNFLCWDYRRLILKKVPVSLEKELSFSTERIYVNFSNYSSWHYRSNLRQLNEESVDDELTLVLNAVFTDPEDSSTWFYLRWVLNHRCISQEKRQELLNSFTELEELEPNCKWCPMAKCWLTHGLCLKDESQTDDRAKYYQQLINMDPIRKGHYEDFKNLALTQEEERKEASGDR